VVLDGDTYIFTFDKYANTLTMSTPDFTNTSTVTFLPEEKAPAKHPDYTFPDYTQITPSSYIALGKIDYQSIYTLAYEGSYYNIAVEYYGDKESIPALENANRPVQSGDVVNINYVGKLDGVPFANGTANGVTLFVSDYKNSYIPGFTDGLIGHSAGETFDVEVTFPENYHTTDMAGKTVIFTMTINNIRNLILTDEQVAGYAGNDYQTCLEWLEAEKIKVAESALADAILKACTTVADLPQETYLYFYQQTIDYYHMLASYYGISYETLASFYGITDARIIEQAISQATYNLSLYILDEENSLAWSEEDYTAKYEEYVENYLETYPEDTREDACEYADKYIVQMKYELTEEKVLDWALNQIFAAERE
jgi:trigger factor